MATEGGEFDLIARYFAPLAGEGAFGFKDDAARFRPSGSPLCDLVISQDAICEGVHFNSDDPPELVSRKAIRVNVSDLIAKGAKPKWFSLALGLSADCNEDWIAVFAEGLAADVKEFDLEFTGGDLVASHGATFASVTMIGEVPEEQYRSRLDAMPGDTVFVTGTIGDAAAGLALLQGRTVAPDKADREHMIGRYHLPQPRVAALDLVRRFANASMDISDGLFADLEKLCKASEVSAVLNADAVPLSGPVHRIIESNPDDWMHFVGGGDDYEILLTVDPKKKSTFETAALAAGIKFSPIGELMAGSGEVSVVDSEGNPVTVTTGGYNHFS